MKKFIILAILISATNVFAAVPELIRDGTGQKVQVFSPDGTKSDVLTINSKTVDHRSNIAWGVYVPADCKFRAMSTATKVGNTRTISGGQWFVRGVNQKTPFVNYSNCANGELDKQ